MLRQGVTRNYLPGVSSETSRDAGSCHEIMLNGPPWSQNSSYNLVCLIVEHSRSVFAFFIVTQNMLELLLGILIQLLDSLHLPKEITFVSW